MPYGQIDHIIDPEGEVILILHNQNPPFAVSEPVSEPNPEDANWYLHEGDHMTDDEHQDNDVLSGIADLFYQSDETHSDTEVEPICFQVSAKALTTASTVFSNMLKHGWKEGQDLKVTGQTKVIAQDWDAEALLIVLRIIHAQTEEVPRTRSLEEVAKIALITDYYGLKNVAFFASLWLEPIIKGHVKISDSRDLMIHFWVCYVFDLDEEFTGCAEQIIRLSEGLIDFHGFPFPSQLRDELNAYRLWGIEHIIALCETFQEYYAQHPGSEENNLDSAGISRRKCVHCRQVLVAVMTTVVQRLGLQAPYPSEPYPGLCLDYIKDGFKFLFAPRWKGPHSEHWALNGMFKMFRDQVYDEVFLPLGKMGLILSRYKA